MRDRRWRHAFRWPAALLLMIAIAALAMARWSERPRRQRQVTGEILRLGGHVVHDDEFDPLRPPPEVGSRRWLLDRLDPEKTTLDLTMIDLDGRAVTDDDLKVIAGLSRLKRLYLNGTAITDAGLAHLTGLDGLERLELRETTIGDAGLVAIGRMTNLRELNLYGTRISDAGLAHLGGLSKLERLALRKTRVSDAGLMHLTNLPALQELLLEGTRVTDAGVLAFERQAGRPGLRVYREMGR
jgi:hypothetical protein